MQRLGTIILNVGRGIRRRSVVSAVSRYWLSRTAADPAAPAPAPDAPGQGICICSCQHHFVPDEPQEMGLDVGDFVLVLKAELHTSEGWIFAEHVSGRSSGYVPVAYLQFVREWNDLSGAKSGDA